MRFVCGGCVGDVREFVPKRSVKPQCDDNEEYSKNSETFRLQMLKQRAVHCELFADSLTTRAL